MVRAFDIDSELREKKPTKNPYHYFVAESEMYNVLTSLVIHSEQIRWTRLNTLIVVESILVGAWVALFVGIDPFEDKAVLLTSPCILGIILGFIFAPLGRRTSDYLDDNHEFAETMEQGFPNRCPRPFLKSKERRESVQKGCMRVTSSKNLVTFIPLVFSLFFIFLLLFVWTHRQLLSTGG